MKTTTRLWVGLGILAAASPIGLLLPHWLKAGPAWGEWSAGEMKGLLGYVPRGLEKISSLWNAILPGYAFKGWGEKGLGQLNIAYVVAAIIGIALCVGVAFLVGKLLTKKKG